MTTDPYHVYYIPEVSKENTPDMDAVVLWSRLLAYRWGEEGMIRAPALDIITRTAISAVELLHADDTASLFSDVQLRNARCSASKLFKLEDPFNTGAH